MHRRRSLTVVTALVGVSLLAAACTDTKTGTATQASTAPANADSTPANADSTPLTAATASNEWALTYTGGTAGPADETLEPIVIGYVNQEGGVPAFPEATAGTKAAVEYVNKELGGIGGHPLQLKSCAVQAEEDGQKCGTEMVNDPKVQAVLTGVLTAGSDSLYKVVAPKLPVIVGNPVSNPDFLTPDVAAFTPGSPGVIQGLAVFIAQHLSTATKPVKKVAVVYGDNEGAKAAVNVMFDPALAKLGITDIKAVPVSDAATAPDLQAALQAAGAQDADVVVPLVVAPLCIATYDAMKSVGISPTVVTTGLCLGTSMTQHLRDVGESGDVPNGWYFGGYGYSYFMPDEASGMATYLTKVKQYGGQGVEYTGFAGPQFGNVLTIAKFLNEIGADHITADAIKAQIASFTGPMTMTAGPMACGKVSPVFPALCGAEMGIQQYVGGKWVSVNDALNGQPINPGQVLGASS
jgi:branched-chain amino acid transport system substrate-binding protein